MPTLRRCALAALVIEFALTLVSAAAYADPASPAGCQLEPGGESTVLAIAGPQTLHLADGRLIRLAEILPPAAAIPGSNFDPSAAAVAYLQSVTLGRKVEVRFGGGRHDRYGVTIAHVYVAGESQLWLQEGLVSAGLAQVFPQTGNHACFRQLAVSEMKARRESRGLWGLAFFKVLQASDARSILNLVQTYQIIEGKAEHVAHAGARLIVHFSEKSKTGFNAVIEPAALKQLSEQDPDGWQGKMLRIRGWIERKKGPAISITQPEQLELLDRKPGEIDEHEPQQ